MTVRARPTHENKSATSGQIYLRIRLKTLTQ